MANRVRKRGGANLSGPKNQGHQTMVGPGQHYFAGVGLPKSHRRSNGARPRKMYPYVRKDQQGTNMETFINKNYEPLQEQWNSKNRGSGRMDADDATGRLGGHWGNIKKAGTTGKAISKHISDHGSTVVSARRALLGKHQVSFGADPKSR